MLKKLGKQKSTAQIQTPKTAVVRSAQSRNTATQIKQRSHAKKTPSVTALWRTPFTAKEGRGRGGAIKRRYARSHKKDKHFIAEAHVILWSFSQADASSLHTQRMLAGAGNRPTFKPSWQATSVQGRSQNAK